AMNEESIFAAALERVTVAERRGFLHEACEGNVALRERVERLLAAHDKTAGILGEASCSTGTDVAISESSHRGVCTAQRVALVIAGSYKLIEENGEGGVGSVWVAEQMQPVRRKVAIKLIRVGMDSKSVSARFDAERQALAVMDHPNIAKVLDGGSTE